MEAPYSEIADVSSPTDLAFGSLVNSLTLLLEAAKSELELDKEAAKTSLATAFFVPDRLYSNAPEMIHGIHLAFLALGALTILSTLIFADLKKGDGDNVSQHNVVHATE